MPNEMPTLPIPAFAALILGFLFLRLWVVRGTVSPLGLLLALCALQSLIIALAQHYGVPGMRIVQPITATFLAPAAWLAYVATAVRPFRRLDLWHALLPLVAIAVLISVPQLLDVFLPLLFVAYGAAILIQSLKGPDAQPQSFLANGDLPSRIWLVIGLALIASALSDILIFAAQHAGLSHWRPWIISLFTSGNLLLVGLFSLSSQLQGETPEASAPTGEVAEPDAEVWQSIQSYMSEHRPYLDPDLTLARLSRKLGIPAKTISATINRATGDNVSRFVNAARIEAAQMALLNGESITSAMLASGFNTKSNFNREFLRVTGLSPSKWVADQST
ncbi:MAG: AraC family transcriptional regulator [Pseudomonadota bacterium]